MDKETLKYIEDGQLILNEKMQLKEDSHFDEKQVLNKIIALSENEENEIYLNDLSGDVILVARDGTTIDCSAYDTHAELLDFVAREIDEESFMPDDLYDTVVEVFGWATLNTGDGFGDDRCKLVIMKSPTQAQINEITAWIDILIDSGKEELLVFCGERATYDLTKYDSKQIIKEIQRYFVTGILEEKELTEAKADQEKLKQFLNDDNYYDLFMQLKPSIKSPQNDIYYWLKRAPEELKTFLDDLKTNKDKKKFKDELAEKGARLVYSDKDWKVYEITNYEASAKYGANTKWCISGSKQWANGEAGESTFNDYYNKDGVRFYFFIRNNDKKYALTIYPNGNYEIFNSIDKRVNYIPNAPEVEELSKYNYSFKNNMTLLVNAFYDNKLPFYPDCFTEIASLYSSEPVIVTNNMEDFCSMLESYLVVGDMDYKDELADIIDNPHEIYFDVNIDDIQDKLNDQDITLGFDAFILTAESLKYLPGKTLEDKLSPNTYKDYQYGIIIEDIFKGDINTYVSKDWGAFLIDFEAYTDLQYVHNDNEKVNDILNKYPKGIGASSTDKLGYLYVDALSKKLNKSIDELVSYFKLEENLNEDLLVEANKKPADWRRNWNNLKLPVVWGATREQIKEDLTEQSLKENDDLKTKFLNWQSGETDFETIFSSEDIDYMKSKLTTINKPIYIKLEEPIIESLNEDANDIFSIDEQSNKVFHQSNDKITYFNETSNKDGDYELQTISINKLIQDNDLNNPIVFTNHAEVWGGNEDEGVDPSSLIYDASKDTDRKDIIYGKYVGNKIKLSNGRHRVRALKNSGYEFIELPILKEDEQIILKSNLSNEELDKALKSIDVEADIEELLHELEQQESVKITSQTFVDRQKDAIKQLGQLKEEVDEEDNKGNKLSPEQVKFFSTSRIRNKKGQLLLVYHGTTSKFSSNKFTSPINWFSSNKAYSRDFSELNKDKAGYIYECYLNCSRPLYCGNTDGRVYELTPVKPYKFTKEFLSIINKLGISEDEARKLVKDIYSQYHENEDYEYKAHIHVITRETLFKDLAVKKGYDCIVAKENGNTTIGAFNPESIKLKDNTNPTNSVDFNR